MKKTLLKLAMKKLGLPVAKPNRPIKAVVIKNRPHARKIPG